MSLSENADEPHPVFVATQASGSGRHLEVPDGTNGGSTPSSSPTCSYLHRRRCASHHLKLRWATADAAFGIVTAYRRLGGPIFVPPGTWAF